MATKLGQTTAFVRRFAVFLGILIIIITILQITTGILFVKDDGVTVRPSDVISAADGCPKPNSAFGKLAKMALPSLTLAPGTKATFSTDLGQKKFLTFPSSLNVYQLNRIFEKLDDIDRVRVTAQTLGFDPQSSVESDGIVKWQDSKTNKVFSFDKTNHIWELYTDVSKAFLVKLNPKIETYDTVSQNLINAIKLSNSNYVGPSKSYNFVLRKFDRSLQGIEDITLASILRINYFKNFTLATCKQDSGSGDKIYKANVYAPEYLDQSFVAQITGDGTNLQNGMLTLKVREFDISKDTPAIYAAKTMDEAYSDLQANKGTLYWLLPNGSNIFTKYKEQKISTFLVNVDKTQIVYIEPQQYVDNDVNTHFIQPYYEFFGQATLENNQLADFTFLVPALKNDQYI